MKDEVDFLPADKCQMFPHIDTIILGVWPGMAKLPKKTSLLFLCNTLRKKWVMKLIFCIQTNMEIATNWYYGFNWDSQAFPKFPKWQGYNVFTISQKRSYRWCWFLNVDKYQSFLQVDFNTLGIKDSYKLIL